MSIPPASRPNRLEYLPVIFLIVFNILAGILTFKDYGLSFDEPLFYSYADSVGYAYSPSEWLKPGFDLELAYGPSAWDHKNRGPAYLLLARGPAHLLQASGLDQASAWHLVNFLSFQAGVFFLYRMARRWMKRWAAFFTVAFFCAQPVIWEHAFINPKDPPFLAFFIISLELGFRMADYLASFPPGEKPAQILGHILVPAVLLGLTTSIRILGPFVAVLVGIYFLFLKKPSRLGWFFPYAAIAILAMFVTWPFLWENPVRNFFSTLTFMADNPTELRVLFYGEIYRADNLPIRYLPAMMLFTLTEPVWPLAILGAAAGLLKVIRGSLEWKSLLAVVLWFLLPMLYVLAAHPPLYDGFRHFMFIIPPLFILGGLALEALFERLQHFLLRAAIIALLLVPGIQAYLSLHPYEYAYYNQMVGGTRGVAGKFETDYWMTCFKDAMVPVNKLTTLRPVVLYVPREGYIAAYYAVQGVRVIDGNYSPLQPQLGQYVLESSRANLGIQKYVDDRNMVVIKREQAVFCTVSLKTR